MMSHRKFGIVLALILLISVPLVSSVPMKNIDYLAKGYNIFKGNPLADSVDPGFTRNLFDLKYAGKVTADRRYDVPIGTEIEKQVSCSLDWTSEESTTERSYYNKLSAYASLEGGYMGASFSASAGYQKVKDEKETDKLVHIITTGECMIYRGVVDDYFPPVLDPNFKSVILERLPEVYDNDQYFRFINAYGTHFVSEIWMGSRMSVVTSLTQKDRNDLISQGIDIKASASYSGLVQMKASGGVSINDKKAQIFQSKVAHTHKSSIGSKPPANGKEDDWTNQVIEEPMPVKYVLMPISDLIDMENLYLTEPSVKVQKLQQNVKRALNDYCKNLKKQDPKLACETPPIEKQQEINPSRGGVKFKNNCALCAKRCGGAYTVETGAFAVGIPNRRVFQTFGMFCSGTMGYSDLDLEGARFCCMPETPQKYGSCKFCTTCGSNYPAESGRMFIAHMGDGWMSTAGDQCLENVRPRKGNMDGYNLCCTQHDICTVCTSCGGQFPYETGIFGLLDSHTERFASRGAQCFGNIRTGRVPQEGYKYCCSTPAAVF